MFAFPRVLRCTTQASNVLPRKVGQRPAVAVKAVRAWSPVRHPSMIGERTIGAYEVEKSDIVFNASFDSCNPIPIWRRLHCLIRRKKSGLDFHTAPALE